MTDPICYPLPDLRQRIIASAIQATYDRLNIAPICRPRPSALEPSELEILLADLRRAIGKRCRRPL